MFQEQGVVQRAFLHYGCCIRDPNWPENPEVQWPLGCPAMGRWRKILHVDPFLTMEIGPARVFQVHNNSGIHCDLIIRSKKMFLHFFSNTKIL